MLANKSLTQLRGIAQSFGVDKIFEKTEIQLIQDIEMKQRDIALPPMVEVEPPHYDARLMTKPPAKKFDAPELMELLDPYIVLGLRFEIIDNGECWKMSVGKKHDSGSMRSKPMVIVQCARKLMA